jgi:hypothetical protein
MHIAPPPLDVVLGPQAARIMEASTTKLTRVHNSDFLFILSPRIVVCLIQILLWNWKNIVVSKRRFTSDQYSQLAAGLAHHKMGSNDLLFYFGLFAL